MKVDRATGEAWLVIFFTAPLAVLAFAYVTDVIFGGKSLILAGTPARGIERFAAITVGFCALELLFAAFILLRRRRVVAMAGLTLYLLIVSMLAMIFGTFRA
ncbi:MAG TPA: hypothetical protein VNA04_17350 [Thermoanaerobaculia bacterium]|nr:hypothetical protein [Thermoanaerobaculia bacterium]